tara:strand:- start:661 stop:957 length:297 start_codon:yes stop_codon:yes gene_type:complete
MWFWLFCASGLLNVLTFLYIRWLLKIVANMNEEVQVVMEMTRNFESHLSTVYEMEMFYGDDTLKSLIDHAKELSQNLQEIDLILNEETEFAETPPKED